MGMTSVATWLGSGAFKHYKIKCESDNWLLGKYCRLAQLVLYFDWFYIWQVITSRKRTSFIITLLSVSLPSSSAHFSQASDCFQDKILVISPVVVRNRMHEGDIHWWKRQHFSHSVTCDLAYKYFLGISCFFKERRSSCFAPISKTQIKTRTFNTVFAYFALSQIHKCWVLPFWTDLQMTLSHILNTLLLYPSCLKLLTLAELMSFVYFVYYLQPECWIPAGLVFHWAAVRDRTCFFCWLCTCSCFPVLRRLQDSPHDGEGETASLWTSQK